MKYKTLIISHGQIATEMVQAVEKITQEPSFFTPIDVNFDASLDEIDQKIRDYVADFDKDDPILILTDVFGASPCNHTLPFLNDPRIEILSGYNLPILLKLATSQISAHCDEAMEFLIQYGRENIRSCRHLIGEKCKS